MGMSQLTNPRLRGEAVGVRHNDVTATHSQEENVAEKSVSRSIWSTFIIEVTSQEVYKTQNRSGSRRCSFYKLLSHLVIPQTFEVRLLWARLRACPTQWSAVNVFWDSKEKKKTMADHANVSASPHIL